MGALNQLMPIGVPRRATPGPQNSDSFGSQMFGADNGPNPIADPYEDNAPNPYDQQVSDYLNTLQQPVTLPQAPPVPAGTAMAMVLKPEMYDRMMALHRDPYERQKQEMLLNEQRQGQAAGLASQLANRQEARQERAWEKGHMYEQAAVNAGNVNYPYRIKGNREAAMRNDQAMRALTGSRQRSNTGAGAGPKPKFPTKAHHLAYLESRMAARQSQLTQLYNASTQVGWDRNVNGQQILQDSEEDYGALRKQRKAIGKMTEDQWKMFQDLPDQEQDAVIDSMSGTLPPDENALPQPWSGQPYDAGPAPPPPWK